MTIKSKIALIANYSPELIKLSSSLENDVNKSVNILKPGIIEKLFGVRERRYASNSQQCSDIGVAAAQKLFNQVDPDSIDCLIFASGSTDLIEPATCNIVQAKLGLKCPAIDVKNACNSFVCALQVADSFIRSGVYKKIIIVTGEKVSSIIKFAPEDKDDLIKRLACLSMGDAGAAAVVEKSSDNSGIYAQQFATFGKHWQLCTVPGGGSMFPRDSSKVFFEGDTRGLKNVFLANQGDIVDRCLEEAGWELEDVDHFFMHHVSISTFQTFANTIGADISKFYNVIESHGNMAAASIPFAMAEAVRENKLQKGDKVMTIGLASGISIGMQLMIW